MSFPEIIEKHARHPSLRLAGAIRQGRPAIRTGAIGRLALLVMEEKATLAGLPAREVRRIMHQTLGAWPENLSRAVTVDEAFSLCDGLNLGVTEVFIEVARREMSGHGPDEETR